MSDYALLDHGDQGRLERFGPWVLDRPSPQAFWRRREPALWEEAHARYERSSQGGGDWRDRVKLPESWSCAIGGLQLGLRRTGFGHIGVFPEQIPFWEWISGAVSAHASSTGRPPRVLNLFAYTGGSSLASARAGAEVTHCDASRGVVQWASENAAANELGSGSIRWIVDDALKFLRREDRRQNRYDAVILDPPSFGRGPKGEVFKLEESAPGLLGAVVRILDPESPAFVLFSAHTPGLGPMALGHLLRQSLVGHPAVDRARIETGEMAAPGEDGVPDLPAGTWSRAVFGVPS